MAPTTVSIVTFFFFETFVPFAFGDPAPDCRDTGCVNGDCIAGTLVCQCRPGFLPTAIDTVCEDINECVSNPCNGQPPFFQPISVYGQNVCENIQGSYRCSCNFPYFPSINGTECINSFSTQQQQNFFLQTLVRLALLGFDVGEIFGFKK